MCGIAGIFEFEKTDHKRKIVENMLEVMKHRGPDASGLKQSDKVLIGSVRLSMVDSQNTEVILNNEENNIFLSYNGEIYNQKELSEFVKLKGHILKTKNDGELIIHLYEEYGKNFVKYLDGMFAFAILDNRKINSRLIIGRDRWGIKPLYYFKDDNKFLFSSELRPILTSIKKQRLSIKAISSYLKYRFVAQPLTPFENIYKVCPSEIIEISDNRVVKHAYQEVGSGIKDASIENVFNDTIDKVLISDQNIGGFLSGGIDSGIVCSLAAQNKMFPCFTIRYAKYNSINEDNYALEIAAKHLNIKHHIYNLDETSNIIDVLNKTIISLEEPLYSTVSISTYLLSQTASKYVKGVLTGDGSDELFMSYQYLKTAYKSRNVIETYKKQISWLSPYWKSNLFYDKSIFNKIKLIKKSKMDIQNMRNFEIKYRLPNYHLARVDKLSMANSIEARIPFLMNNVATLAEQRSFKEILETSLEKENFKKAFKKLLPKSVLNRKKQPFSSPYQLWIENEFNQEISRLFKDKTYSHMFNINYCMLNKLLKIKNKQYFDYTAIWGIFMLYKWYEHYQEFISNE